MEPKIIICISCGKERPNFSKGRCQYCARTESARKYNSTRKRTAIPKKSQKKAKYDQKYPAIRKKFLAENSHCAVYSNRKATEVHHKKGRQHDIFADDWARENDIPLLIDVRFFLAVSREGHNRIEEHPNWAKENGFSLDRL